MNTLAIDIDKDLVKKYDYRAFMYTEYPHKSFWSEKLGAEDLRKALKRLFSEKKGAPLLLYLHIPFCQTRCYYCTCHTVVTDDYKKVKRYLSSLFTEIDLMRDIFKENSVLPNFREIHIGGGSPTFLTEQDFGLLIEKISSVADIKNLSEFTIEIDPRRVTKERIEYYHTKGINRISFGIQDFDPDVQKAINRIQPPELIEALLTPDIRKRFGRGLNFDILCGLPLQTEASMRETFERIVKFAPDRVCLNYLHFSPKFAPHQKIMFDGRSGRPTRLPDLYEKKRLFLEALNILLNNGYVRTGYDHFTRPDDDIAKAMRKGAMGWNALGVTSGRYADVIGLGLHSWSTLGGYYFQNVFELPDYEAALSGDRLPVARGHKMSKDDLIRREVIQTLRNLFFVDFRPVEERYGIDFKEYFRKEAAGLDKFRADGMLDITENRITLTDTGRQFADVICAEFDKYI